MTPKLEEMKAALGTPVRKWESPEMVSSTWQDSDIEISFLWMAARGQSEPFLSRHVEDIEIVRYVATKLETPHFKKIVAVRSFF